MRNNANNAKASADNLIQDNVSRVLSEIEMLVRKTSTVPDRKIPIVGLQL